MQRVLKTCINEAYREIPSVRDKKLFIYMFVFANLRSSASRPHIDLRDEQRIPGSFLDESSLGEENECHSFRR